MRILHIANHAEKNGNGIVNVMVDLACLQSMSGHDVAVATSGGSFEALLSQHGAHHYSLLQTTQAWRMPAMLWDFHKIVAEFAPDVVHAHMVTGAVLAKVNRFISSYALVTTIHNEFQKSSDLMRAGDCVVSVSDAVAASMTKRGVPKERMHVVRNGVVGAPRLSANRQTPDAQVHRPSVVTVSGMYERKGMHDLVRAFAEISPRAPEAHLYLVGDGPDRADLEMLSHTLGISDKTHFTGYVADPRSYLQQADVFVLPSHSESGPLALMEAREAGCAIVATMVGGIPETLDHGAAGIMVPPSDPPSLAKAILALLIDEQAREMWKGRAQSNLQSIAASRVHEEYLQIYSTALSRRGVAVNMHKTVS